MGRLIFLLEEQCMQALLEGLLPRLFPDLSFLCVPHSGKTDLERSIRNTLQNWRFPNDRFMVVRDNDGADCIAIKERLLQRCRTSSRADTMVRVVCQELESWYLGDPEALAQAFGDDKLLRIKNSSRFRDPDRRPKPSKDLEGLVPQYRKTDGARKMAMYLTRERNRSHSFSAFLEGVERLQEELC